MLEPEVARKVRRLGAMTRRLVAERFAGQYHSVFKGRGLELQDIRPYHAGDDVRFVDWKVSARSDELHVRRYVEERELTVVLAIDVSGSLDFGTLQRSKREVAAEIAAVVAWSALQNQDKVGLLLFNHGVVRYLAPRRGRGYVLRIVTEILQEHPHGKGTDLAGALEFLHRVLRRRSVLFVLSDFLAPPWEDPLRRLRRRHDVIPILLEDRAETELPAGPGLLALRDAETQEHVMLDLQSRTHRDAWHHARDTWVETRNARFRAARLYPLTLDTALPWVEPFGRHLAQRRTQGGRNG